MFVQDKIKIIEKLSEELSIYFHDVDVTTENVTVDSHFLKFVFDKDHVLVTDSYVLPGTDMKDFINEYLPYKLEYATENFTEVLLEEIDVLHSKLIALEILEEENIA